ncbi:TlpA disulfide reductase family protein [Peribacillus frigoritolerans]|uniref:TlpA disulfide reductase family protein n=1 Tax=Peribacillus frigoritolerans TaxID=450367 RepID=UPI0006C2FB2A|nr:TlpA disulfide reductase family protein [Peribacillus frigoritolerans]KOR83199.1 alkyl hydroperoxide reductase [Bacillus sp. FJAT-22058]AZV60016.1 TlpA family protein disulfide reductase [Peribacillus frigoritolerans]MCY9138977.1 TlpA family protein disulfide reductase [Peribacillus frigoritolerans]USK82434.1 TlpA family protein disulfide reductase [Peribacillus frigoritolerans]WJE49736.1 TlpA disulfide reductase family protein [Peribacillus frigoritolerans]
MLKKIIASVALLSLITVAIVQAMDNESKGNDEKDALGGLKIGAKAPNFSLKTLDGKQVELSDYEGKKVMLNFWATWCPPCKKEMPDMEKYTQQAGDDVVVLAVNIDPENDVQAFVEDNGITFTIPLDSRSAKNPVNERYKILSIPTTYFIDKKGIIRNKVISAMTLKDMERNINSMQ